MKDKAVQEVIKKNKIDQKLLPTMVLYLYEANPNTIQHSKLAKALTASEKDLPLVQHGTKDIIDYKESLKKEALQDGKKKNALQEFVAFLNKNEISFKVFLPGVDLQKRDRMPYKDFQQEVKNLKYKGQEFKSGDIIELMTSLDNPKDGKTVNLKKLHDEIQKS